MDFESLIASLRELAGESVDPGIYDNLTSSYQSLKEGSAAAVAEKEATILAMQEEITKLKAHNYELLMQTSVGPTPDNDIEGADDDESEGEDITIDDLFGKDEN